MQEKIIVRGAREHNLRDICLELPHGHLIVFTGLSGSGKSSLAFDTLYAEGQRRYMASLSSYARQFLHQLPRPDVDAVLGIPPALCIDQKSIGRNPRSTVGTLTEAYDFLRVIWARVGQMHCPQCGAPVGSQAREAIVRQAETLARTGELLVLAPLVTDQRGHHRELLAELRRRGYLRVRVDGVLTRTDQCRELDPRRRHRIEVVVDRFGTAPEPESRFWEAVDSALVLGKGQLILAPTGGPEVACSTENVCPRCGATCPEPTPAALSFNLPQGWCPACQGLGRQREVVEEWLIPDPSRSVAEGALLLGGDDAEDGTPWGGIYRAAAAHLGFDLHTPWSALTDAQRHGFLYGITEPLRLSDGPRGLSLTYEGVIPRLLREAVGLPPASGEDAEGPGRARGRRRTLERVSREVLCPSCRGARLRPESLAVRVGGRSIAEAAAMTIAQLRAFIDGLQLPEQARAIAGEALLEVRERLGFLGDVGVDYLTLDRPGPSLSGGEAQRIRLAAQVGRGLAGVLYVLDEPSIGLHQRDNRRLIATLRRLRDRGSTVIIVEHDEETIRSADYIVDFGPGAGSGGGRIVAQGSAADIMAAPASVTGRYLRGAATIPVPRQRRAGRPGLRIVGAHHHNLKRITVEIPAGTLTVVTGVSGSGKSSLVADVLQENLTRYLELGAAGPRRGRPGQRAAASAAPSGTFRWWGCEAIEGAERFDKVVAIDQSPIGRIPRSNPATYTNLWDGIRALYAQLPEARLRGYTPGHFSFNVPGGRCPVCEGNGALRVDMDFLADVWVPCSACGGSRFAAETLQVRYRGHSIADLLGTTVAEALELFRDVPVVRRYLQTLTDVGLGYLQLGQPSPQLSGGEAQRIKLARELARRSTGRSLYILDEPTTGLHFQDVAELLQVLQRLVDQGNTVVVVEHHLDVIKVADRVIDLGPEGGEAGGYLVACGTPEEVAATPGSPTGVYLAEVLRHGHILGHPQPPGRGASPRGGPAAARREAPSLPLAGELVVVGAQQHNLRNLTLRLPKERLVVLAGPSGSGKTSLALDTIHAEGQRRYVESLSAYARQFLARAPRPAVERIDGLCPAIAVDQRPPAPGARSTVGTLTEIYDYLRLLFARAGEPRCTRCGGPVQALGSAGIAELARQAFAGAPQALPLRVLAPTGGIGDLELWRRRQRQAGFARYWQHGRVLPLEVEEGQPSAPSPTGSGEEAPVLALVVDRVPAADLQRLQEAVSTAVTASSGRWKGWAGVQPDADGAPARWWAQGLACAACGLLHPPLDAHTFSFNDPRGWCPACSGTGQTRQAAWEALVPAPALSLAQGGLRVWGPVRDGPAAVLLSALGQRHGFTLDTPLGQLTEAQRGVLLAGDSEPLEVDLGGGGSVRAVYRGLSSGLEWARSQTHFGGYSIALAQLLRVEACSACEGSRLGPLGRAARLGGRTLPELLAMPLGQLASFFASLELGEAQAAACAELLREIRGRLEFLCRVGLDYMTLGRSSAGLSGGEAQRIRLASQLGSSLTGVLYVLDEPTAGLHPRDTQRLLQSLHDLKALGNSVLVVEHDPDVLAAADHLVEFGPGSGSAGGRVVAEGTPDVVARGPTSVGSLLRGEAEPPPAPRRPQRHWLELRGARLHNLKGITCAFPLSNLVAVTGVSGSGKSSLVMQTLYPALAQRLQRAQVQAGPYDGLDGLEQVDKVICVDSEPVADSPRASPATYTGIFDALRRLFARVPEARARGYGPNHFSYNHPEGQCERCEGHGYRRIAMQFLPDVWVLCDVCGGRRYRAPVLEILYRGLTIADCLALTVDEALERFANLRSVVPVLRTLQRVGLGYLRLGQPAHTLSAGEAQRLKLANELARPTTGRTVIVLDEPTSGLSVPEVHRLLQLLHGLVDAGNTVICIEHHLDVVASADWVIDLGPEGGEAGGWLVAAGPPEAVAQAEGSRTAPYLRRRLEAGPRVEVAVAQSG